MKKGCALLLALVALLIPSCRIGEAFDPAEMPDFAYDPADDSWLLRPWNYDASWNAGRAYPLLVYLHGSGSSGDPHAEALAHFGAGSSDAAIEFKSRHPSFVFCPHTAGGWDNDRLIAQIDSLRSAYRIDPRRLYLVGYSMGGSGSYALANALSDRDGSAFAGIVRLAGQSQTELRPGLIGKTAVWLQVGLLDEEARIVTTRQAWDSLRASHHDAGLWAEEVPLRGHPGLTSYLEKDGERIALETEYREDGHGISNFPFADPALVSWLFSRELPSD